MMEKTCGGCIYFGQYVGDCTGECRRYPDKGWLGTDSTACESHWDRDKICLICKHWRPFKQNGEIISIGKCRVNKRALYRCDSFCKEFERREDYKEFLERIMGGEE